MGDRLMTRRFIGCPKGNIIYLMTASLLLTGLSGCLSAPDIEKTRFYAITPGVDVAAVAETDWTLGIRPLFASRSYGTAMAYLGENHQISYLLKDEWAEQPANTITRAISDALSSTKRFADVGNAADMVRPDLLLTGELRVYQENRTLTPPVAEVEVRLELRQSTIPGSLWAETVRETEVMASDSPQDFAEAMNRTVGRLAEKTAESLAAVELPVLKRTLPPAENPR
jgi:ABC-type uncharacterized transport system auxiliary subunit